MLRRASARTGREKTQRRESVWTDLPWLSARAHGWRSSSVWVSSTAASIAGCQSLFTTLNDSWLRGKGIQLGWEWPPLLPFLHSGFLTFKGHFVFPKFSFPACMNLKWIRTKSTRWVVMFPTIICSQGMNILYSKSDWRFIKKKRCFKNKTGIHSFVLAQEDYSWGKQKYRTSLHSWIVTEWIWICVWGWSGVAVVGTECPLEKRNTQKMEGRETKTKATQTLPAISLRFTPSSSPEEPFRRCSSCTSRREASGWEARLQMPVAFLSLQK